MYEIERVADSAGGLALGPDYFKLGDTAHDTLINDTKSVRDKKSKLIYKARY